MKQKLRCYNCKEVFSVLNNEDEIIECPICGWENELIRIRVSDTVVVREMIGTKSKSRGEKKPFKEAISGDEFSVRDQKWYYKKRKIDRQNDTYEEKILDKETGRIIHECKEKLSEHKNHGSAKIEKKK